MDTQPTTASNDTDGLAVLAERAAHATVPLPLAQRLASAGLTWTPRDGDRFVVPGRGMDERAFLLAPMVVEIRRFGRASHVAFNGTTEWALDQVLVEEVVWLPREADLLHALGTAFLGLWLRADRWVVECLVAGHAHTVEAGDATAALGEALIAVLEAD